MFELETVRELLPNVSVRSAAISPDGRTVAVTFPHDEMLTWEPPTRYASGLWDVATGRQLLTFQQGERRLHTPGSYGTVSFSPDGRRVAAGFPSDGFTGVWAVEPADREAPKK